MLIVKQFMTTMTAAITTLLLIAPAHAATPPAVTDDAPAAGKRVRVTAPGWEGTDVYHTLYLPTDWQPGQSYPVIVEYAPNPTTGSNGSVEATHMGFYQSGGTGFIWVSMPFINESTNPDSNLNHGEGNLDAAADYNLAGLVQTLENYGGDPSAVFLTGFSRGSYATGRVGRRNDEINDAWLGFLPYGQLDNDAARMARIGERASFITYGENDGFSTTLTPAGITARQDAGAPVEWYELEGIGHDYTWITDANGPLASTNDEDVTDVRARMREWIDEVLANRPGTSGVSGTVTDGMGNPIEGVKIQSGTTHWTFTDANGEYELFSLMPGERLLQAIHDDYTFDEQTIVLGEAGLLGQDFSAVPEPTSFMLLSLDSLYVMLRRRTKA